MFKRRKTKELERIQAEFDRRTAEYYGEDIWDLRQFLMLLNLADNGKMGKSKAIIYAYKLGHEEAKQSTLDKVKEHLQNKAR